jgi:hypothetical protein
MKAILLFVCLLKIRYKPRGIKEKINGYTILKTHMRSKLDKIEYKGAIITILNIAFEFENILVSHKEDVITLLAR